MAGDRDRERVGGAGTRHRAGRCGRSDATGDVGVTSGRADWYGAHRLPDPPLERGAGGVEPQVHPVRRSLDHPYDPGQHVVQLRAGGARDGPGTAFAEVTEERGRVLSQQDGADPPLPHGDEHRTEGAGRDGVVGGWCGTREGHRASLRGAKCESATDGPFYVAWREPAPCFALEVPVTAPFGRLSGDRRHLRPA
jgi:hypothetical protein